MANSIISNPQNLIAKSESQRISRLCIEEMNAMQHRRQSLPLLMSLSHRGVTQLICWPGLAYGGGCTSGWWLGGEERWLADVDLGTWVGDKLPPVAQRDSDDRGSGRSSETWQMQIWLSQRLGSGEAIGDACLM
ncbi:hypothetical protein Dimus_032545 [Dionaea muscipula]